MNQIYNPFKKPKQPPTRYDRIGHVADTHALYGTEEESVDATSEMLIEIIPDDKESLNG